MMSFPHPHIDQYYNIREKAKNDLADIHPQIRPLCRQVNRLRQAHPSLAASQPCNLAQWHLSHTQ